MEVEGPTQPPLQTEPELPPAPPPPPPRVPLSTPGKPHAEQDDGGEPDALVDNLYMRREVAGRRLVLLYADSDDAGAGSGKTERFPGTVLAYSIGQGLLVSFGDDGDDDEGPRWLEEAGDDEWEWEENAEAKQARRRNAEHEKETRAAKKAAAERAAAERALAEKAAAAKKAEKLALKKLAKLQLRCPRSWSPRSWPLSQQSQARRRAQEGQEEQGGRNFGGLGGRRFGAGARDGEEGGSGQGEEEEEEGRGHVGWLGGGSFRGLWGRSFRSRGVRHGRAGRDGQGEAEDKAEEEGRSGVRRLGGGSFGS